MILLNFFFGSHNFNIFENLLASVIVYKNNNYFVNFKYVFLYLHNINYLKNILF